MIYLDTHALVWMLAGEVERFSSKGKSLVDKAELIISPMVVLELEFLYEIGRITQGAEKLIEIATQEHAVRICSTPWQEVVFAACADHWTRDPFDRLIVANARVNKSNLLSMDRGIRKHYLKAIW